MTMTNWKYIKSRDINISPQFGAGGGSGGVVVVVVVVVVGGWLGVVFWCMLQILSGADNIDNIFARRILRKSCGQKEKKEQTWARVSLFVLL